MLRAAVAVAAAPRVSSLSAPGMVTVEMQPRRPWWIGRPIKTLRVVVEVH